MYFLNKSQFRSFQNKKTMKIVLASVIFALYTLQAHGRLSLIILNYKKRNSPFFP